MGKRYVYFGRMGHGLEMGIGGGPEAVVVWKRDGERKCQISVIGADPALDSGTKMLHFEVERTQKVVVYAMI